MSVEQAPVPRTNGQTHRVGYDEQTRARLSADCAAIKARYPQQRSALLPMLHLVQSEDGYVSPRGIAFCAAELGLTTAEVSAVATFYTQYKRHPNGTYTVGVCTNTLCAIMGGDAIWEELSDHLGVGHDETTDDGAITLERIECNAACDYAPVVMVNWEFFDNQTPGSAVELADELTAGRPVTPTRGADSVCTFKEMSRVLAGFDDGRADEGVGAGVPTLRGTVLARENGWEAPPFPGGDDAGKPVAERPVGSEASTATPPRGTRTTTATGPSHAPQPGGEQSSAERPATTSGDVSPERQQTKQQSDDAKES
ncbi:NADH-quinone oxidoreductase subunit NuoE [Cellulomonas sp. URHB0016]